MKTVNGPDDFVHFLVIREGGEKRTKSYTNYLLWADINKNEFGFVGFDSLVTKKVDIRILLFLMNRLIYNLAYISPFLSFQKFGWRALNGLEDSDRLASLIKYYF